MIDYWVLANLDWTQMRLPDPAPCVHGLSGAPYCAQCLEPLINEAALAQAPRTDASTPAPAREDVKEEDLYAG